jgi:hypothetical protein
MQIGLFMEGQTIGVGDVRQAFGIRRGWNPPLRSQIGELSTTTVARLGRFLLSLSRSRLNFFRTFLNLMVPHVANSSLTK